jgi:hypothetical protein
MARRARDSASLAGKPIKDFFDLEVLKQCELFNELLERIATTSKADDGLDIPPMLNARADEVIE